MTGTRCCYQESRDLYLDEAQGNLIRLHLMEGRAKLIICNRVKEGDTDSRWTVWGPVTGLASVGVACSKASFFSLTCHAFLEIICL